MQDSEFKSRSPQKKKFVVSIITLCETEFGGENFE